MEQVNLSKVTLILGFFDGIHLGHRRVLESAVRFAKENNSKTVLLTFPESPAEYFKKEVQYIYPRETNYKIIRNLGIDFIKETNFRELVNISAEDYLKSIISEYSPIAIFTGFNYTFGANRTGSPNFIKENQQKYGYKYFCIEPVYFEDKIVSSTLIKKLISEGKPEYAHKMLTMSFSLTSTVIKGSQTGRAIGFPTANTLYPENIIKLPYGVYEVRTMGKTGVLNWGIKPTIGSQTPLLETHILDFSGDLYGKELTIEIIKKIRDERKFNSLEELKIQINKDIEACLK